MFPLVCLRFFTLFSSPSPYNHCEHTKKVSPISHDTFTLNGTPVCLKGLSYLKAHPQLTRTQRLMALNMFHHGAQTDDSVLPTPGEVWSFFPDQALAQASCLPFCLAEKKAPPKASTTKKAAETGAPKASSHASANLGQPSAQKPPPYVPFSLCRTPHIPLYALYEHKHPASWGHEFNSYLEEGEKLGNLMKVHNPFDMPPLSHEPSSESFFHTLIGTSDAVSMWGAVGLLALRCSVTELKAALSGTPLLLRRPSILGVRIEGNMPSYAGARDIVHKLMDLLSDLYLPHKIIEFFGPNLHTLSLEMRQEISALARWMDAEAVLWPISEDTLRTIQDKPTFKALAEETGLWEEAAQTTDDWAYDERLTLSLSTINPGYAPVLASRPALMTNTQTWQPPYTPPTAGFPSSSLPITQASVVLPSHIKIAHDSILALSLLLEKMAAKELVFKAATTLFVHPDYQEDSPLMQRIKKDVLALDGSIEFSTLPFGTHVVTTDGSLLWTSEMFACLFSVLGTTYDDSVPDLSPNVTIKDVWPEELDIQKQSEQFPASTPDDVVMPKTRSRPFWCEMPTRHSLATTIQKAHPLPIFRNHDLTFSLLARGPMGEKEPEPFEAYRNHPYYLKKAIQKATKKYVPKISESFLEDDVPLVIFGGHAYGRAGDWAWLDCGLSLLNVRAVVAHSFDTTIHRALLHAGILPLHWMPPAEGKDIVLDGSEHITITGVHTAHQDNHTVMMTVQKRDTTLFVPLMLHHILGSMLPDHKKEEKAS
ncbi:hypothetical protein EIL50_05105 [bacterium NHP-B]|nr:hypothetical protein EIL50_05105 [bacterium NHP-B]